MFDLKIDGKTDGDQDVSICASLVNEPLGDKAFAHLRTEGMASCEPALVRPPLPISAAKQ